MIGLHEKRKEVHLYFFLGGELHVSDTTLIPAQKDSVSSYGLKFQYFTISGKKFKARLPCGIPLLGWKLQ